MVIDGCEVTVVEVCHVGRAGFGRRGVVGFRGQVQGVGLGGVEDGSVASQCSAGSRWGMELRRRDSSLPGVGVAEAVGDSRLEAAESAGQWVCSLLSHRSYQFQEDYRQVRGGLGWKGLEDRRLGHSELDLPDPQLRLRLPVPLALGPAYDRISDPRCPGPLRLLRQDGIDL